MGIGDWGLGIGDWGLGSIVGFIIVGIVIGHYGLLPDSTAIQTLGKIGMLYIMLQAGIEVDVNDFRQQRTHAAIFGIYSFLLPFALGVLTSRLLGYNWVTSALLGAMYGSHTLMTYPIVSRYGVQKNEAVNVTIGGTMLSISLSLLVLAFLKSNFAYTDSLTTWAFIGRISLTLLHILVIFPKIAQRFFKRWSDPTSGFLVVMTFMVVSAWMADWSGLEGILGAFMCGVAMNRLVPNLSPVMQRINFVGNNIFVPLFLLFLVLLLVLLFPAFLAPLFRRLCGILRSSRNLSRHRKGIICLLNLCSLREHGFFCHYFFIFASGLNVMHDEITLIRYPRHGVMYYIIQDIIIS